MFKRKKSLKILIAFCVFELSFSRTAEIEALEIGREAQEKSHMAMIKSKPIVTSNKQFAL